MSKKKIYKLVYIDSQSETVTQLKRIVRTYGLSSDFVIDVINVKNIDAFLQAPEKYNCDLLLYKIGENGSSDESYEALLNAIDITTTSFFAVANEGKLEEAQTLIDLGFDEVVVLSKPAVFYKKITVALNNKNMRDNFRELREEYRVLKEQSANFLKSTDDAVAYTVDGMFTYFNEAFWQRLGYKNEDDFLGVLLLDLIPSEYLEHFKEIMEQAESQEDSMQVDGYFINHSTGDSELHSLIISPTFYEEEECLELKIPADTTTEARDECIVKVDDHSKLNYLESLVDDIGQGVWLLNIVIKDYVAIWSRYGSITYERFIKAIEAQLKNQFQGIRIIRYTDGSLLLTVDDADVTSIDRIGNSMAKAVSAYVFNLDSETTIQSDANYTYTSLNVEVGDIPKALKTIEQQSNLIPLKTHKKVTKAVTTENDDGGTDEVKSVSRDSAHHNDINVDITQENEVNDSDAELGEFSLLSDALERDNIIYGYAPIADFTAGKKRYIAHYQLVDDNDNIMAWNKGFMTRANNSVAQRLDALLISNALRELSEADNDVASILINLTATIVLNERFAETVFKTLTSNERFKNSLVLGIDRDILNHHKRDAIDFFKRAEKLGINLSIYGVTSEADLKDINLVINSMSYLELHPNLISKVSRIREGAERNAIEAFLKTITNSKITILAAGIDSPTTMAAVWEYNIPLAAGTMIGAPSEKLDFDFSQIII